MLDLPTHKPSPGLFFWSDSVVGSCIVEVSEPEEMGMCCSLFPFSPLLTHGLEETGSVGESEWDRMREWGEKCVCPFAYVMVEKNVENVCFNLSVTLIVFTVFPWKDNLECPFQAAQ